MIFRNKTGETIDFISIDTSPTILLGGVLKFGITNIDTGYTVLKTPIIEGNFLKVRLQNTETRVAGVYLFEFRVIVNSVERSVGDGYLILKDCVFKEVI